MGMKRKEWWPIGRKEAGERAGAGKAVAAPALFVKPTLLVLALISCRLDVLGNFQQVMFSVCFVVEVEGMDVW